MKSGEGQDAVGDSPGLAALLRVLARVGPAGVDQRDEGQSELLGQPRQPHGLAVALRAGHTETPLLPLLESMAFLVAHQDDLAVAQRPHAAHDGRVVGPHAVAPQFHEVGQHMGDVIEGLRALLMPGDLDDLPGAEYAAATAKKLDALLDALDLLGVAVESRAVPEFPQALDELERLGGVGAGLLGRAAGRLLGRLARLGHSGHPLPACCP